jgi:hypothetical protein
VIGGADASGAGLGDRARVRGGHLLPGWIGRFRAAPGRSVTDAAADYVFLLAHLGVAEYMTVGWPACGPHALAQPEVWSRRSLASLNTPAARSQ